jgi:hypothetical protein
LGFDVKGAFIEHKDASPSYFGSNPEHRHTQTSVLLDAIDCQNATSAGMCDPSSIDAMTPMSGQIMIGAYGAGAFISDLKLTSYLFDSDLQKLRAWMQPIMTVYQNGRGFVFSVMETVNAYGYAYFEGDQLLRLMCGDIDQAVITDFGHLLQEEIEFGVEERGKKMIKGRPISGADGCDITFALTGKFWGVPLNQFDGDMQVEKFET